MRWFKWLGALRSQLRQTLSVHLFETYVTIFGTVLGLLFTWSQLCIAQSEEDRAQRAEPLSYTLTAVDTHYQYAIQAGDTSLSLPAPSLRLQVTHGSLHSITAISFDGTTFHELSSLPIREEWDGCLVDITMPSQSVISDGSVIYDYFFLYLEPTEGPGQLDLICNTISLSTQEVQSRVYHPISLAQLDYLSPGPLQEMLSVYDALYRELETLHLLAV